MSALKVVGWSLNVYSPCHWCAARVTMASATAPQGARTTSISVLSLVEFTKQSTQPVRMAREFEAVKLLGLNHRLTA